LPLALAFPVRPHSLLGETLAEFPTEIDGFNAALDVLDLAAVVSSKCLVHTDKHGTLWVQYDDKVVFRLAMLVLDGVDDNESSTSSSRRDSSSSPSPAQREMLHLIDQISSFFAESFIVEAKRRVLHFRSLSREYLANEISWMAGRTKDASTPLYRLFKGIAAGREDDSTGSLRSWVAFHVLLRAVQPEVCSATPHSQPQTNTAPSPPHYPTHHPPLPPLLCSMCSRCSLRM
jgi:hypothetical protein